MQQVIQAKIPIRIKNVIRPKGPGTVIVPDSDIDNAARRSELTFTRGRSSSNLNGLDVPKSPTAVTVKRSVIIINLCSNKTTRAHGFLSKIFQILDTHNLSVDLIASSEVHISLALHFEFPSVMETDKETFVIENEQLKSACNDLRQLGSVDVVADMAIISLVGQKLKNMIGISGKFFRVLGESGINIEMISQGTLRLKIFASNLKRS